MRKGLVLSFAFTSGCAATTADLEQPITVDAAVTTTVSSQAPRCGTPPAPDLAALPAGDPRTGVLALEFPRGLDFAEPNRQASLDRFDVFVKILQKRGAHARLHFERQLETANDRSARVAALTALEQTYRHMGQVLATAEIPVDVRTGADADAKTAAFCAKLVAVAAPLLARADETAELLRASATAPSP